MGCTRWRGSLASATENSRCRSPSASSTLRTLTRIREHSLPSRRAFSRPLRASRPPSRTSFCVSSIAAPSCRPASLKTWTASRPRAACERTASYSATARWPQHAAANAASAATPTQSATIWSMGGLHDVAPRRSARRLLRKAHAAARASASDRLRRAASRRSASLRSIQRCAVAS